VRGERVIRIGKVRQGKGHRILLNGRRWSQKQGRERETVREDGPQE
jgi:hypothetical protein